MTHEEIAEAGWNARFPKTPWTSLVGYPREKQLSIVAAVVKTGAATSEMEHWYLRAFRGEFDAAPVVADKPQAVPVAVVVEKPGKKPAKKEK